MTTQSGTVRRRDLRPDLHDIHHLWLKAVLLAVWVAVSFGACYYARDLQALVPDWPLAYWFAAQGQS